jgi:hypothetical protein
MKKIVLSQTCQGLLLRQLLMSSAEFRKDFACTFIPNYEIQDGKPGIAPPTALENALESCDILIYHDIAHYDFPSLLQRMPPHGTAITIPYITSTIYWPSYDYRNPCWLFPRGATALIPWPCTKLNELIVSLHDKKKAMDAYLQMDIPATLDIRKAYDGQIGYLRKAEHGSIFNMAAFIENNFREKQLFHLINHPSLPVFLEMANAILGHLGLPLLEGFRHDPFAGHQIPVHPSVIAHYGLSWCDPKAKYRILEKTFTFEEYVAHYIRGYVEKYGYVMHPPQAPVPKALRDPWRRLKAVFAPRGKRPA